MDVNEFMVAFLIRALHYRNCDRKGNCPMSGVIACSRCYFNGKVREFIEDFNGTLYGHPEKHAGMKALVDYVKHFKYRDCNQQTIIRVIRCLMADDLCGNTRCVECKKSLHTRHCHWINRDDQFSLNIAQNLLDSLIKDLKLSVDFEVSENDILSLLDQEE